MVKATDYELVAAGQTNQVMGPVGAKGDQLRGLTLVVATAATATVSIKDGAQAAIVIFPNSPGGGIGTYAINFGPDGLRSFDGAWQITTGAGVSVLAQGRFT